MIGNLDSRLNNLLLSLRLSFGNGRDQDDREMERYLEILRDVPPSDLSAGKRRVLAEAERLQTTPVRSVGTHAVGLPTDPLSQRIPLVAGAWAGVTIAILLVAVTVLFAQTPPSGHPIWGLWGTGTIASTLVPWSQTAGMSTQGPAATTNPTPVETRSIPRAVAAATPQPVSAPAPVHGPPLTLTSVAP